MLWHTVISNYSSRFPMCYNLNKRRHTQTGEYKIKINVSHNFMLLKVNMLLLKGCCVIILKLTFFQQPSVTLLLLNILPSAK